MSARETSIREILARPMLELLGAFVNLTREDKDAVLELQAHLLAIHRAQSAAPEFSQKDLCKAPRLGGKNRLMLESEITRLGITIHDLEQARRTVIGRAGMPPEVPQAGKIAVDLELANNTLLDALICAQAGEMMLQAAERIIRLNGCGAPDALPHLVAERTDGQQIARNYIGRYDDDSRATVTAQACAHLADIAAALPGADMALAATIRTVGYAALRAAAYKLVAQHHLSDARDLMQILPEDGLAISPEAAQDWLAFVHDGIGDTPLGQALLKKRQEQADISVLLNDDETHEDLALKDLLRKRLSAAK